MTSTVQARKQEVCHCVRDLRLAKALISTRRAVSQLLFFVSNSGKQSPLLCLPHK